VLGNASSDQVSFTSNGNLKATAKMLTIVKATDLGDMISDGILGLAPQFINGDQVGGELFVTSLFKVGLLTSHMFSLSYQRSTDASKFHLGGYLDSFVLTKYSA
jgi:hypothetical protein